MSKKIEAIRCPSCLKIIRPVFSMCRGSHLVCTHCQQHLDGLTGQAIDRNECDFDVYTVPPILNKLFGALTDSCQNNCGYSCNLTDVDQHERNCYKYSKIVKCYIENCLWRGTLNNLVAHVDGNHPSLLVELPLTDKIIIGPKNPVQLITQYHKKKKFNKIFWVRCHSDARNIIVLYVGSTIAQLDTEKTITNYTVCSSSCLNNLVQENVVYATRDIELDILDDVLLRNNGANIFLLPGEEFFVKLITPPKETLMNSLLEQLECHVCAEIMSARIKLCVNGHNTCGSCAEKLKKCPKCSDVMTAGRNYALEHLARDVLEETKENTPPKVEPLIAECRFRYFGCGYTCAGDLMQKHWEECEYQETRCILCKWTGKYTEVCQHLKENHSKLIQRSGVAFNSNSWHIFFSVYNNNFVLTGISSNHVTNFSVHHLTPKPKTNFTFDLVLSNVTNGKSIQFGGKCHASKFEQIDDDAYLSQVGEEMELGLKWFEENLNDINEGFLQKLIIYDEVAVPEG